MANKDPPKSKDISDVSFIFNDKMVSKTREYMREHAELEVIYIFLGLS